MQHMIDSIKEIMNAVFRSCKMLLRKRSAEVRSNGTFMMDTALSRQPKAPGSSRSASVSAGLQAESSVIAGIPMRARCSDDLSFV